MADRISGTVEPSVHGGEGYFTFSLDGLSTAKQMEKLIGLTEDLVKRIVGKDAESLKEQKAQTAATNASTAAIESETDARKLSDEQWRKSTNFINNIFHGRFGLALDDSSKGLTAFAGVVGFAYGKLENYGNALGEGLKRGVAGSTFDLAIAAKSAGVSITTFTKALGESGGGFASLGDNATDGARQFGGLVKSVRLATADVGNLGMNLDEMAVFTAQQTKTAIQQGFKGKTAQDVVIKNSRELGKELDVLASRTGKSVMELAQAAMKLSQDPIVSNFVRSMRSGGKEVSASIQSFAASMRGLFGEEGDKLAQDALQSAISGLPLAITDTGKNMILAGSGIYEELERQARKARSQEKITDQDRERLRDLVMNEVKGREQELAVLAQIPGAAGDSARALLKMADQAEFLNSKQGKEELRRADAAKQFNAELRSLQASLQEMLIPFLKGLNSINWASVFQVISFIPRKIGEVMDFIGGMIKMLPEGLVSALGDFGSVISKFGGAILGIGVLLGMVAVGAKLLNGALGIMGKGLSVLGVTTLPTYISKYAVVNRALDSFTASLFRASVTAKTGGNSTIISGGGKGTAKAPAPGSLSGWQTGPTASAPTTEPAGKTAGKGGFYNAGRVAGRVLGRGGAVGILSLITDQIAGALGTDTISGKIADTISTGLLGAGAGMSMGSPHAAIGLGLGGLATGVYKNFFSDNATPISGDVTSQAAEGDNPVLRAQLASIEQQKKTNDQMAELINEQATSNRLAAMGLGKDDDLARRVSNLSLT